MHTGLHQAWSAHCCSGVHWLQTHTAWTLPGRPPHSLPSPAGLHTGCPVGAARLRITRMSPTCLCAPRAPPNSWRNWSACCSWSGCWWRVLQAFKQSVAGRCRCTSTSAALDNSSALAVMSSPPSEASLQAEWAAAFPDRPYPGAKAAELKNWGDRLLHGRAEAMRTKRLKDIRRQIARRGRAPADARAGVRLPATRRSSHMLQVTVPHLHPGCRYRACRCGDASRCCRRSHRPSCRCHAECSLHRCAPMPVR